MMFPMISRIVGLQVGLPREVGVPGAPDPLDRPWTTGFYKLPAEEPIALGSTGFDGDGVADTVHHGGPDKAVLAYAAAHYPDWRRRYTDRDWPFGAFGENLTLEGLTEDSVCIGDRWTAGEVLLEISQPRQPCWKLARRWRIKELAADVVANGRSGWYLRVLRGGTLSAGVSLSLIDRPNPQWTIGRANLVLHHLKQDREAAASLAACPQLSRSWKETLAKRADEFATHAATPQPPVNR